MPTINTSSIGSNVTRDYADESGWEAATDNDLPTADTIEIGELYDDSEFNEAVTFGGATTDSTRYRILRAASGHEYDPVADTGARNRCSSGFATTTVSEDYFRFETHGRIKESGNNGQAFSCNSRTGVRLDRMFLHRNTDSGSGSTTAVQFGNSTSCIMRNTICVSDPGTSPNTIARVVNVSGNTTCEVSNCVVDGGGRTTAGILQASGTVVTNVVAVRTTSTDFAGTADSSSDYNASEDTTSPGTNSVDSVTPTDEFTAIGSLDYTLKTGADCIDAGDDLSADFTTDFNGDTHGSSGTWEIGAYDFATGAVTRRVFVVT